MLAFFAVKGIKPDEILSADILTQRFYYHAMELYYKEKNELIDLAVRLLGGK